MTLINGMTIVTTLDDEALLGKHNPILVLFPHDPKLIRPGTPSAHARCGDYHPCNVEFFMANAHLLKVLPPYKFDLFGLLSGAWKPLPVHGARTIAGALSSVTPDQTKNWVLDLARIPSQKPKDAWEKYAELLNDEKKCYKRVVYGRVKRTESGTALQYWYLYLYNDFVNDHEADWEMATIQLDKKGEPYRMGISAHLGGWWLPWKRVGKDERHGHRPIVYVARGSHAGYFSYSRDGFRVDLVPRLNLPAPIKILEHSASVARRIQGWVFGWRDRAPAHPQLDRGAPPEDMGVPEEPDLKMMPDDGAEPDPNSEWWWMRYRGRWGSGHTRIFGTIGPDTPWGPHGQTVRWTDPVEWIEGLRKA